MWRTHHDHTASGRSEYADRRDPAERGAGWPGARGAWVHRIRGDPRERRRDRLPARAQPEADRRLPGHPPAHAGWSVSVPLRGQGTPDTGLTERAALKHDRAHDLLSG